MASATNRSIASAPNSSEIVRLFAVLEAESLAPGHPAHSYFETRQERALAAFTAVAGGSGDRPASLARQVMALMDGLRIQWLRDPEGTDLVAEWEIAAATLFG